LQAQVAQFTYESASLHGGEDYRLSFEIYKKRQGHRWPCRLDSGPPRACALSLPFIENDERAGSNQRKHGQQYPKQ